MWVRLGVFRWVGPRGGLCKSRVSPADSMQPSASSPPPPNTTHLRSILFFIATNTAVTCSHAFPAIGSTMNPRNPWLSPHWWDTSSMDPVSASEQAATMAVMVASQKAAPSGDSSGPPSCSSGSSS